MNEAAIDAVVETRPSALLERQHRQIDEAVQGIVRGSGTVQALVDGLTLLREHLYIEEQILFPPLQESGLSMPVFVMKREHGLMWPLMRQLLEAGKKGCDPAALQDDCETLLQLLQAHNPKEETIVYAAADRLAASQADPTLVDEIAAAQMPDDWTCQMAPGSTASTGGRQAS